MRILIVEDDEVCRLPMEAQLSNAGHEVEGVDRAEKALALLDGEDVDVVITDVRLPGLDGLGLIQELKRRGCASQVVVITAYGTVRQAVEAMKLGAQDYLTKPVSAEEILLKLERLVEFDRIRRDRQRLQQEVERRFSVGGMVGVSAGMRRVLEMAEVARDIDATVLIVGETGVGKEALARAIHYTGRRKGEPFVAVSCQALSRDILESELFGHEQGAFTGAIRRKLGRFELAEGGTLFLDDVDDIPLELQVKLLRVLDERAFERVGGEQRQQLNCRILCATKGDLLEMARAGRFREDLYYRIKVIQIVIPPLRERREDIPVLAEHFLAAFAERFGRDIRGIEPEAMKLLVGHNWPGNVRELEHVMERAVAFADGQRIAVGDLAELPGASPADTSRMHTLNLPATGGLDFNELMRQIEREALDWAMFVCDNNQARAAKFLGIPRTTLQHHLSKHRRSAPKGSSGSGA